MDREEGHQEARFTDFRQKIDRTFRRQRYDK